MLAGTFALVERSLRLDARARSTHLVRFGLMVAIYLGLCQTIATVAVFGAPGLRFFSWISGMDAVFLTLLGVSFYSSVITEEKEEDTLGLMMMAGISPLGILLGKSVGGLWQSVLIIAIQYPFSLLAITMGGVTHAQVWSMTLAFIAYVIFLAGLGLLCSTVSSHGRTASWLAAVGVFFYFTLPSMAQVVVAEHSKWVVSGGAANGPEPLSLPEFAWPVLNLISLMPISYEMSQILTTGSVLSTVTVQVVSNILMGLSCLGLSRLLFGMATRHPSSEAITRGMVTRRRGFFRFSAGRTWANPFIWKDFYFASGGWGMVLIRCAFYVTLGLIPLFGELFFDGGDEAWIILSIYLLILSSSIGAARLVARSMQDEITGKTLPSLMMLPRSSAGIVYSKYAGALLGWLPGTVLGPLALLTNTMFRDGLIHLLNEPYGDVEFKTIIMLLLGLGSGILYFLLTPHFAAYLALYMRWGAVPAAIGLTYCMLMIFVFAAGILAFMMGGRFVSEVVALSLTFLTLLGLTVACHISILLRIHSLASK